MKFAELGYGKEASLPREITQADVDAFIKLTGDNSKIHCDPEYAAETEFEKPIVHGMLVASFISTMIGTILPGEGAVWNSEVITWHTPIYVGDTITVRAWVINSMRGGFVQLQTNVYNQRDEIIIRGHGWVKMRE